MTSTPSQAGSSSSDEHPRIDLTTFFLSISSTAFRALDPAEGVDLAWARQNIDLLELMHQKTRGNRSPTEDQLLEKLLFEARIRFVDASSGKKPATK